MLLKNKYLVLLIAFFSFNVLAFEEGKNNFGIMQQGEGSKKSQYPFSTLEMSKTRSSL